VQVEPNKTEITKLVGVLFASFPTVEVSEVTIKIYVRMLSDIPLEVLKATIEQCLAESEFLPTIAKLRDKALSLVSAVSNMPTAFEAWGIVVQAMGAIGSYGVPDFGNEIIQRAVDAIGWKSLCMSENQVADRAHFAKVYDALLNRAVQDQKLMPAARQLRAGIPLAAQITEGFR